MNNNFSLALNLKTTTFNILLVVFLSVLFIGGVDAQQIQNPEEDLWADVDGGNATQQSAPDQQAQYAEPEIQMLDIQTTNDLLRMRPPPNTFKNFRQGSIDFWVKYDPNWEATYDTGTIVALSNGYDTLFEFSMSPEGDAIFMANAEDDAINGERSRRNGVNFDFTDGLIHHVALVTDNNLTKMYVDGRFVGEFSLGYAIPEDAQGQRQDLQLSIGSLDGRINKFQGQIGALRIWGIPLDANLLLKAAFMRDNQLLSQGWAKSFLIAHLANQAGQHIKPRFNMLANSFNRPEGVWMTYNNVTRVSANSRSFAKEFKSIEGSPLNYEYKPQAYSQLLMVSRNSELGRFAGATHGATRTLYTPTNQSNRNNNVQNQYKQKKAAPRQSESEKNRNIRKMLETFGAKIPDAFKEKQPKSAVQSEIAGYTKLPGKFVLGGLVKVIKSGLAQCAQACSYENKCIEFSYNTKSTDCYLISSRDSLATVNNTSTYTKTTNASQVVEPVRAAAPVAQSQVAALKSPLAVQRPTQAITNKDIPVLVELLFDPNQGVRTQVKAYFFEPLGRNKYQSANGMVEISSSGRMRKSGAEYTRVSNLAKSKKTDANVKDVFIVGNQIRNKNAILVGYNPLKLDPFNLGGTGGGLKKPIFKHSQYGFNNVANRVIPLGLDLKDIQSGEGRVKAQEASSQETIQKMLGGSVSASLDVNTPKGGGTFSANANFKSTTDSLSRAEKGFTFSQSHQTRFILLIDKSKIGLTADFKEAVLHAARRPSSHSAMQLVKEFGTHYAHSIAMGGRIIQMMEFTKDEWAQGQTYAGGLGAAVEARIGPKEMGAKIGAAASVESSQTQAFESKTSNTSDKWKYVGGQGTGYAGWNVTDDTVTPIFLDLRAISEVLAPPFFTNPTVFNTLRPLVHQALKRYVNENKGDIKTVNFKPAALKLKVNTFVAKKACKFDKWKWRSFKNTDSRLEGGGVWARFKLPAKAHGESVSYKAGCKAGSHGDGPADMILECNRVCWKATTFTCNDGKWENLGKKKVAEIFSEDILCHSTGETTQDHLFSSTGNAPWVFPPDLCEMWPPGLPGRPNNCNDDF